MGVVIRQHDAAALGWPYEGLYGGVGSPLDQLTAGGVMIVLRGIHQCTLTHHRHLKQEVESITGPCFTTATWCCRKNFSRWERSFLWKLHCHWLKGLRQCQIIVVRQGPVRSHEHHAISDHKPPKCLFDSLCRLTSKKHHRSTLLALCEGNPSATSGFPSQCMSNAESVSILWRHYVVQMYLKIQWVGIIKQTLFHTASLLASGEP